MMEIDGSYGEGGGQIVRTATALSAVIGTPIKIKNIRKGRKKPGLAAQHAVAIEALATLCRAKTSGVAPGSLEITFEPGKISGGSYSIDIGTAGSITLLAQCLLPAALMADAPVSLEISGGTDVRWSPSIDYFRYVFLPALEEFGARVEIECSQRGYYPRGGGRVLLNIDPGNLKPCNLERVSNPIKGISHCSGLPEHVAKRQSQAALNILRQAGLEAEIPTQILKAPSVGSGITLWSGYKGAGALGESGVRAEEVGSSAAREMISDAQSPSAVDVHLADQLVPYLALAGGIYTVREISMHAKTNIWTAGLFLDRKISISGGAPPGRVFLLKA